MAERPRFGHGEHLVRVAVLFLAGTVLFLGARALLVPEGFGVYGHYRAGALLDARGRPVSFAGQETCEACHDDVAVARKGGRHAGVRCEACHGPQARHADADDPAAVKPVRPGAALCERCHARNVARPESFPQVDLREHAEPGTCLECHAPHQPAGPPEAKP